ncbi:hypothetical protein XNA1_2380002 [Xenorhabdus nematophila str. Anatoliense]|nr:hypothetical protein XNA1_2380002 [Xenorhabdus nematophila str. Anatoliense]
MCVWLRLVRENKLNRDASTVNVKGHRAVNPVALSTFPLSISERYGSVLKTQLTL